MPLAAADEAAVALLLLLTPTVLRAAVPPPLAFKALAIKLRGLLPPFRLRKSGLGLVVSRRCRDCQLFRASLGRFSSQSAVLVQDDVLDVCPCGFIVPSLQHSPLYGIVLRESVRDRQVLVVLIDDFSNSPQLPGDAIHPHGEFLGNLPPFHL